MENTAIVPSKKSTLDLLREPENLKNFELALGSFAAAKRYAQSVMVLVMTDEKLQACTPESIVRSALRAATCELSVDPAMRQAYLIPRPKKIKASNGVPEHYVQECGFQPHYNGLFVLATRTNVYRVINVSPVYRGYDVYLDPLTGLHYIEIAPATETHPQVLAIPAPTAMPNNPVRMNVTSGKRPYEDIIGYIGFFETYGEHGRPGMKKTVWMTQAEIEAHAKQYSDAYKKGWACLWTKSPENKHRPVMEQKTVFIALTKFMDLTGPANEKLREAIAAGNEDDEDIDLDAIFADDMPNEPAYVMDDAAQVPEAVIVPPVVPQAEKPRQAAAPAPALPKASAPIGTVGYTRVLTYEQAGNYIVEGKPLKDASIDELEVMSQNPKRAQSTLNAIKVVRDHKITLAMAADLESGK